MKRNIYSFVIISALAVVGLRSELVAQIPQSPPLPFLRVPRISQGAKVTQVVGLSELTIFYHRPGVKGRAIFGTGNLLPYDTLWRAGANEPTLFTFSDDVTIAGKKLSAGMYRFVTIPGKAEWTCIFNSEVKNWGTIYDGKYDTLRFKVTPESGPHEEWLSYSFTDLTPSSAKVVLAWEKVRVGFTVEFNTVGKIQASVGTWQVLNSAARFAIDNKMNWNEAMVWIDRSIALDKNARNLQTKAELQAQGGKTQDAIATAEDAVKVGKAGNPKFDSKPLEQMISDWKNAKEPKKGM